MKFESDLKAGSNRLRRGWIIRILNYFNQDATKRVNDRLMLAALQEVGHDVKLPILHADLRYLAEKGYILAEDPEAASFAMFTAALTARGVDLYEGTISDPGVDFGHDD